MLGPIWVSLVLALLLMVMQFSVPHFHRLKGIPPNCLCSFSAGFTISYIFLHLLPGLAEHRETIGAILSEKYAVTPVMYLVVYIVGLIGFLLFYGLEKIAHKKKTSSVEPGALDFYTHLFAICLYCVLFTYTMPVRVEAGLPFAILFTFVMGFHFFIVDHTLEEHFPKRFSKIGRFIILGSIFLGWILSAIHEPENVFLVAVLTAFLGGSILMNVFQHELPKPRHSSFTWLTIGAGFGTALLLIMTILEQRS